VDGVGAIHSIPASISPGDRIEVDIPLTGLRQSTAARGACDGADMPITDGDRLEFRVGWVDH
jgi:hypothetical protein